MAWVETHSLSFVARHESGESRAVEALLGRLEAFRTGMEGRFPRVPNEVEVVVHPRAAQLSLAAPWVPLARLVTAPASRRYLTGAFGRSRIHTLSERTLRGRASSVAGSEEALRLAPLHEYVHLVLGAGSARLPPPFTSRSLAGYLRWGWLCEGAATHYSGQSRLLRGAVARRLREGRAPSFPPSLPDALLLGGTVYDLLEEEGRDEAAADLALQPDERGASAAIERAFGRPVRQAESAWRDFVQAFAAG